MDFDVIVLGAGIVGVSCALYLTERGKKVVLIDRREPGEETSYGNAGLIERAAVIPYGFPRDFTSLLQYASNHSNAAHYDMISLPSYLPWLLRYWHESSPARLAKASADMLPLISRSVDEHQALIQRIGTEAQQLVCETGLLEAWRDTRRFSQEASQAERLARRFGLSLTVLDGKSLGILEPSLNTGFAGALHWHNPKAVNSPGDLTKSYARLFIREGGSLLLGDAKSLQQVDGGWTVRTMNGDISASSAVLALGPWSDEVFRPLGYRIPLTVKRGYHRHYRATQPLNRPVVDVDHGYVVAPMKHGLRLTTGVELARRDRPPSWKQLINSEYAARQIFPLGEALEDQPWMGMRPCLPDMRPVIGPAPNHDGLWFCFGHNHHGLTLGPVSGRLLAEMVTGVEPFTDPMPYSASRFA